MTPRQPHYNDLMSHVPGFAMTIKPITTLASLVLLASALSACDTTSNPNANSPASHTTIIASGHPEWPPHMYHSGAGIGGAGPALVKKNVDARGRAVGYPQTDTWDQVKAKA